MPTRVLSSALGLIFLYCGSAADAALAGPVGIPRLALPPGPILTRALIVTHASRLFDPSGAIAPALDTLVSKHKILGLPVIYLMNEDGAADGDWLTADREPTIALNSQSGEHQLEVDSAELTFAGGYFELCQAETVMRAAQSYFKRHPGAVRFTANFPMAATYSEKLAFRDPPRRPHEDTPPIDALASFDHPPTLAEVLDAMADERRFVRALGTATTPLVETFCVTAIGPSGLRAQYKPGCGCHGTKRVEFRFFR